MLGLAEHEDAEGEHRKRPDHAGHENGDAGALLPEEDIAHERDERIHGVHLDDADDPRRRTTIEQHLEVPEDGSKVRPSGKDNAPKMHDVAEEDGKRADGEPNADAEQHEQEQAHG